MNESLHVMMALVAGLLLGAMFFGGLWWTVQRGLAARQPALWFGASMLLRSAIVLAGFYLLPARTGNGCCCACSDSSLRAWS